MREGKASVRYRYADRLVTQIKAGQRLAAGEAGGQFLDRRNVQDAAAFILTWTVGVLSFWRRKIEAPA
jgi:hypothetical protein